MRIFFLVTLALFSVCPVSSRAQDTPSPMDGRDPTQLQRQPTEGLDLTGVIMDQDIVHTDGYVDPDFENLSHAYWAIGKFLDTNNKAIDNFLLINECNLYKQYYYNEFEWSKLREATRLHIRRNLATFPTTFEILVPIQLGQYDTSKEEFDILADSQMTATRRIDVMVNSGTGGICGITGEIDGYPRNMIVVLSRPFALLNLPVKREIANDFIDNSFEGRNPNQVNKLRTRTAYLRLKIRLSQYKETVYMQQGGLRAVIMATLEGVEVYGDKKRAKLLYSKVINTKRMRKAMRYIKKEDGTTEVVPATPEPKTGALDHGATLSVPEGEVVNEEEDSGIGANSESAPDEDADEATDEQAQ
ncbi:MAG TPA: DUF4852 domain-containing protein [Alphaproteobacteria bacterium]